MKRKVLAANDIYHKVGGSIDTPENFEARRQQMEQRGGKDAKGRR